VRAIKLHSPGTNVKLCIYFFHFIFKYLSYLSQKNIVPKFCGKKFPAFALIWGGTAAKKCSRGKFLFPHTLDRGLGFSHGL
jgi:hypothetical protein